jgi:hypothetical protein
MHFTERIFSRSVSARDKQLRVMQSLLSQGGCAVASAKAEAELHCSIGLKRQLLASILTRFFLFERLRIP